MEREFLKAVLEEGVSLEEIGRRVGRHPSTVAYWLRKHGLEAIHARHRPRGGVAESTLVALVGEGLSVREIAARLDRSPTNVRYWLARYGLATLPKHRSVPRELWGQRLEGACPVHGAVTVVVRPGGRPQCLRCRAEAVSRRRQTVKRALVDEAGGCCTICGYDACVSALHFHHLDPGHKRFSIGSLGTRALAAGREEARKCVLLCSNCHAEVEAGLATLP
jgi:transposase